MNRSTPGLPVHHQLPEFTQTHVHRVGDATQPTTLLFSPIFRKSACFIVIFIFKNTLQQRLCPQQGLSVSLSPLMFCQGILTHSACKEWKSGRHKASDTSILVKKALVQVPTYKDSYGSSLHSQQLQLCGCYRCSYPAESRSPH